ncbi:MAG: hypothetical protein KDD50_02365 [Bdellovibrionales bacterium]|nr:hypothetical protein [Bdellovibrionales bacterium]
MIKTMCVCFLFFCMTNVYAEGNHIPENENDHGPNIPTVGSSLFDKVFSTTNKNGRTVYTIPYPLSQFSQPLGLETQFVHTNLPFSRSLQRPQDLSYNPLLNPRIVFTPFNVDDSYSILLGKIFFGYVEAKDQLEVISFNDEAGRFEYQIITDYSSSPKAFYVDRGKCLSCHQGQAPIFSPPAWADTSFGIMGRLLDARLAINGMSRNEFIKDLFGEGKTIEQLAVFDSFVRESNDLAFSERIWAIGCGADRACRLGLLLKTLAKTSLPDTDYISYANKVISESPLMTQKKFSSFLTAFDMKATSIVTKYGGPTETVTHPEALKEIISNIYNLSGFDNPATKRTLPISTSDVFQSLKAFSRVDFKILREAFNTVQQISDTLIQLYKEDNPIFDRGAIDGPKVMFTLLDKIGSPKAQIYAHWMNKTTPEKTLFSGPSLPIFKTPTLNILSRRCHKCHAAGLSFPPQFLLGSEDQVIEKVSALKTTLLYKLENNLMPPNPIDREELKRSGDYDKIINYVKSL